MKTLVYGIGNPSRGDDGIGYEFLELLETRDDIDLNYSYQLQIEDAELFSKYERIIIIDAFKGEEDFVFKKVEPLYSNSFTTHALYPETIASLTENLYSKKPIVYFLGVKGEEFDLGEGLGPRARRGLRESYLFLTNFLDQDKQMHCHN